MNLIATRDDAPVLVRMPEELLRTLTTEAARNGRSRNSEIILRLRNSMGAPGNGLGERDDIAVIAPEDR